MTKKAIAPASNALPVGWEEELAEEAKALASVERPSVSSISFKSGIMKYMGEKVTGNKLSVIVLSATQEQLLYKGAYDPDNLSSPDCFAQGYAGLKLVPHDNVNEAEAEECSGCPMNEWGSAGGASKGKACKEIRKLAVIPADAVDDLDSLMKAEIAVMKLPVTSVKNWSKYVRSVSSQLNRPAWTVITEVSCEPDDKSQFKVNFDIVEPVTMEALPMLKEMKSIASESLLVPYEAVAEESGKF